MENFLIAIFFSLGLFLEAVFGFGGTIFSGTILGFFIDIKKFIFLAFFFATFSSLTNFFLMRKFVDWKKFLKNIPIILFGVFLGAFFLKQLDSKIILRFFSAFVFFVSILKLKNKKKIYVKSVFKLFLLFLAGLISGSFGGGGVALVLALQPDFKNKKNAFRATLASIFVAINLFRGLQYFLQQTFDFKQIANFWCIFFLLLIPIFLGHKVHFRIPEKKFSFYLNIILVIGSIGLFWKSF